MYYGELDRLLCGAGSAQLPDGVGTETFLVACTGNADVVLQNAKVVLERVLRNVSADSSKMDWCALLPNWFVDACGPERTRAEADRWLETWRTLSVQDQIGAEAALKWTVSGWVFWFEPDQRCWAWWDAEIKDSNTIELNVVVDGWPFAWGALRWLFVACGAKDVCERYDLEVNVDDREF